MYRWYGLDEVPADWGKSVVTIGEFDGVHRGHQRIVARAAEIGAQRGLQVVAITFDPHPDEVVRPGSHPPFLCSARRRAELLASLGADAVCIGRPYLYGLAAAGPAGAEDVLDILREEMTRCMTLMGVGKLADLDETWLLPAGQAVADKES